MNINIDELLKRSAVDVAGFAFHEDDPGMFWFLTGILTHLLGYEDARAIELCRLAHSPDPLARDKALQICFEVWLEIPPL